MKKNYLVFAITIAAMAFVGIKAYEKQTEGTMSDIMLANIEALSDDETSDCDYKNGYVAFTSTEGGGAYDCCKVWVAYEPNTQEGRCR
ncbi:MAG: hypothetical protein IJZ86_05470 [Bacteroides sp.]|nr:hypothetical protein [Bacteroides sp.]